MENNGYLLNSYKIPHDILAEILSYIPPCPSILKYRLVCKVWTSIIDNDVWKDLILRKEIENDADASHQDKIQLLNGAPWCIFYKLTSHNIFKENLVKNNCGQDGYRHWKWAPRNFQQFITVDKLEDLTELPPPDDLKNKSYFSIKPHSWVLSTLDSLELEPPVFQMSQVIDFPNSTYGLTHTIMDELQQKITASVWVNVDSRVAGRILADPTLHERIALPRFRGRIPHEIEVDMMPDEVRRGPVPIVPRFHFGNLETRRLRAESLERIRLLNEGDFDVEFSACSMGMILTYNNNLTKKFEETLTLRAQADERWQKLIVSCEKYGRGLKSVEVFFETSALTCKVTDWCLDFDKSNLFHVNWNEALSRYRHAEVTPFYFQLYAQKPYFINLEIDKTRPFDRNLLSSIRAVGQEEIHVGLRKTHVDLGYPEDASWIFGKWYARVLPDPLLDDKYYQKYEFAFKISLKNLMPEFLIDELQLPIYAVFESKFEEKVNYELIVQLMDGNGESIMEKAESKVLSDEMSSGLVPFMTLSEYGPGLRYISLFVRRLFHKTGWKFDVQASRLMHTLQLKFAVPGS